jgi:lipoprotein-anchoring transpeptidase ErfK/SrfK
MRPPLANHSDYRGALSAVLRDLDIAAVYRKRGYAPLWLDRDGAMTAVGSQALAAVSRAGDYDISLESIAAVQELAAAGHKTPAEAGQLEGGLSRLVGCLGAALQDAPEEHDLLWTTSNRGRPRASPGRIIQDIAETEAREKGLTDVLSVHPLLDALAVAVKSSGIGLTSPVVPRARNGSPEPASNTRTLKLNLARLRALPALPGPRHVVVNTASATLYAYEDRQVVKTMRVVVGAPQTATPMMAGAIEYAILNPYWNIPQDLLRERIAPAVLQNGVAAFDGRRLEALSDWSESARRLDPAVLDWHAIAAGALRVRVRQKPGPDNMMGRVKFMLPNDLGIYLHDTPEQRLFARPDRAFSAGCVRLEDPQGLFEWLFNRPLGTVADGTAEQPVPLRRPVPIYLIYQTSTASKARAVEFWPDIYGRDDL